MRLMIIGFILIAVGLVMMYSFYNLVDIGLVVCIVGIFFVLCGAFTPKVEAKAPSYPIAGISKVMIEATTKPLTVETSEVVEVGIEEADQMEQDIDLLARLITAEVGYSTAYDPLDYELACYLTGSVVLNRMKHEQYPDTLEGVIYDPGQYSPTWNGSINRPYDDTAWEIAEELLTYGTDIDESVIFQANFEQGSGVYQEIGNLKFCYE